MKYFIIKSIIFVSIFSFVRIIPNIVLGDFLFFRFWEKESVNQDPPKLPRFTPNVSVTMLEEGDLNHGLPCSSKKSIHSFTDKYGLRNINQISNSDFLIVGCSNTYGVYCDYPKTFSGLLNKHYRVYNISPDYKLNFLQKIYTSEKPKHIEQIFMVQVARCFTEEEQFKYSEVPFDSSINRYTSILERIKGNYFGNKIKISINTIFSQNSLKCDKSYHYIGISPNIKFISKNIKTLKERLTYFNKPVTIIVIPDKEFYMKGDTINKIVYTQILNNLRKNQLQFVDISHMFNEGYYFHGDSHINELGHEKIYKIISDIITSSKLNQNHQGSN